MATAVAGGAEKRFFTVTMTVIEGILLPRDGQLLGWQTDGASFSLTSWFSHDGGAGASWPISAASLASSQNLGRSHASGAAGALKMADTRR